MNKFKNIEIYEFFCVQKMLYIADDFPIVQKKEKKKSTLYEYFNYHEPYN